MEVKVKKNNEMLEITAPYNPNFIRDIRGMGGKWVADKKVWEIEEEKEDLVRKTLARVFGYVEDDEFIKIEFFARDFLVNGQIIVGKKVFATRFNRGSYVKTYDCVVIEGEFKSSGGSAKHPSVIDPYEALGDNYVEIVLQGIIGKTIYDNLTDEEKGKIKIIEEKTEKERLIDEKEKLLKRLAEIEEKLDTYK